MVFISCLGVSRLAMTANGMISQVLAALRQVLKSESSVTPEAQEPGSVQTSRDWKEFSQFHRNVTAGDVLGSRPGPIQLSSLTGFHLQKFPLPWGPEKLEQLWVCGGRKDRHVDVLLSVFQKPLLFFFLIFTFFLIFICLCQCVFGTHVCMSV